MGKRGGTSGKTSSKKSTTIEVTYKYTNTKFSTKELNSMSRSELEEAATNVFIKQNVARGLTPQEAERRAKMLMSGNTTAQLKKYIKKYG